MYKLGKAKKSLKFLQKDDEMQKLIAMPVMYVPKDAIGSSDLKEIKTYVHDILGTLEQFKIVLAKADNLVKVCRGWAQTDDGAPSDVLDAMDDLEKALHAGNTGTN
jgi:hypothetical protein